MPRSSSNKAQPASCNPYPKSNKFSKSQMEMITKKVVETVMNVLNTDDSITHQAKSAPHAPASEGEGSSDEENEDLRSLRMLSSASNDTVLQSSLVPLRQEIERASKMLLNLRPYMSIFIGQKNPKGMVACTQLIIKYEGIVTKAKAAIETHTRFWEAREEAKRDAEKESRRVKQAKKEDASRGKGYGKASRTEERPHKTATKKRKLGKFIVPEVPWVVRIAVTDCETVPKLMYFTESYQRSYKYSNLYIANRALISLTEEEDEDAEHKLSKSEVQEALINWLNLVEAKDPEGVELWREALSVSLFGMHKYKDPHSWEEQREYILLLRQNCTPFTDKIPSWEWDAGWTRAVSRAASRRALRTSKQ